MTAVPFFDGDTLVVDSPDQRLPSTRLEFAMIALGAVLVLIAMIVGIATL